MKCPYAQDNYAASLADFGTPRWLPRCQGWVLERPVPGHPEWRDATGCYPLFVCGDRARLGDDLAELRADGLISVVLTTDPLTGPSGVDLERWFPAVARPWKDHYLVDLKVPSEVATSRHHRRAVRRFARAGTVTIADDPTSSLGPWCARYDELVTRHRIIGPARFSRQAFALQLALPGAVLFAAADDDDVLGMQIWFTDGRRAWYHLAATSARGYEMGGVSHAIFATALDHFRALGVGEVNLGSGAGLQHDAGDGLSRFKAGWSTHTRASWLCGAVLDPRRYARLCDDRDGVYFPLYRDPASAVTPTPEVVHAGHD